MRYNPDEDLRDLERQVDADSNNDALRHHYRRSLVRAGRSEDAGFETGDLIRVELNPNYSNEDLITSVFTAVVLSPYKVSRSSNLVTYRPGGQAKRRIRKNSYTLMVKPLRYIWNRPPIPIHDWGYDGEDGVLIPDPIFLNLIFGVEVEIAWGGRASITDKVELLTPNYCPADVLVDLWGEAK